MEDNFGRKIDINKAQITAQELLAETQTVQINNKIQEQTNSYEKLTTVVEELSRKIGDLPLRDLIANASSWVEELVKLRQEIGLFKKNTSDQNAKVNKSYDQILLENFKKFHTDLKNRENGLWFGISRFSEVAQNQLYRTMKRLLKPSGAGDTEPYKENLHAGGGGGGRNTVNPPVGGSSDGDDPLSSGRGKRFLGNLGMAVAGMAAAAARHSIELTGIHWSDAFTGIKDLFEYQRSLDMLIYQKNRVEFDNVEKATKLQHKGFGQFASELGAWPNQIQKAWIETLKRGNSLEDEHTLERIKKEKGLAKAQEFLIKRRERLMKDSVFTASYLNMEVESVNEMFNSWHTELGFSTDQMSVIAKQMISISRSTGLVGANLERALKSSESVMKSMRGLGLLNSTSAKAVMKMTADFQRFGFGEEGQAFLQKLMNGAALNDSRFGSLAAQMAGGDQQLFVDIASGRALNKIENRKTMGRNLESALLSDVGNIMGADQLANIEAQLGESLSIANLQKAIEMSDSDTQLRLNTIIRQKYDNDVMAVAAIVKTFKESGKTYEEQVKDLENEIQREMKTDKNETVIKKLQQRKRDLEEETLSVGFSYFKEEMERSNGNEAKARKALEKRMNEEYGKGAGNLFSNFDGAFHKMIGHLREQATEAGLDFDALLKEQGFSEDEFLRTMKNPSQVQRDIANEALESVRQKILTQEKAEQNPYANMEQYLKEINGTIQSWAGGFNNLLGSWGPFLAIFGSIATTLIGFLMQFGLLMSGLQGLQGMWGWAKGKVGGLWKGKGAGVGGVGGAKSPVYDVDGKKTMDTTGRVVEINGRKVNAPEPKKSWWKGFTDIFSNGGGKGGGKGRSRWLKWLLGVTGGAVAGSWLTSGGDEATPSDGGGIPALDGPLPVYVVNWEEICKCTGGINTTLPPEVPPSASSPPSTTTVPKEKVKTDFQNTADGISAINNATQTGAGVVSGGKWAASKIIGKAGKEVGEELVKKAGGKIAGRVIPGLDIGIDAISGMAYAEENNRNIVEGGILGGLTGDSSVGSQFFSPLLGIEENTMWDKMMGVFGSGLRGTLSGMTIGGTIGAAAGAPAAGLGAIPGAGVGALVGGAVGGLTGVLAELYKIWTDEPINPPQTITVPLEKKPAEYKPSIDDALTSALTQDAMSKTTSANYGNGLDYTEETNKPFISSNTYNKEETVAALLEKQRVGKNTMASMPDMSSVNDYLTKTQSDKLDAIIAELRGIRTNTTVSTSTLVNDPMALSKSSASRSNLKRAATGMTRGAWGLQAGPNTQNNVLTDGRFV